MGIRRLMLIAVLTTGVVMSCGGRGNDYSPALGFSIDSQEVNNHTHSVWIWYQHITSPPADGVVYESTAAFDGHTHWIALTQQELSDIGAGTPIVTPSTITDGHLHVWVVGFGL